ncbi:tigger transposable element-derived protein 1 [Trichonephila clavipes]|nr:tigger transposable element-derived protein 1 [Trichonephila clavipes]
MQINLEVNSGDFQELLDSHNQDLTINELVEMHEQEQGLESLDPVQSEDQMTVESLTERISLIKKGLQILENIRSNDEHICLESANKLLAGHEKILQEEKNSLSRQTTLLESMKLPTSK